MKYFTIKELCQSSTATQKGIDNTPNSEIVNNLTQLVDNILDPLRKEYGKPIKVNSGYRCDALNKAVGGSKTSYHRFGLAADITAGSKSENKKLFTLAQKLNLPFDQLIDEKGYSWIHISFSTKPRKQILHL
jgi:uncharacterized protein YcbK (DUF882 family)